MAKLPPSILTSPWAITAEGLQLVWAVATRGQYFSEVKEKALVARGGTPLDNSRNAVKRDGVAVVPISGPLVRHASLLSDVSAATSYEQIMGDIESALNDTSVRAILLDIDSPGGEVAGCGELSKAIFEAKDKKTIAAYVSGVCASAAYWIGSAASFMVSDPSAVVGSIGVRTMLVDSSKKDELDGVKSYDIVSDQSPLKVADPSDADDRARIKSQLTAMASVFINDVARNRGVSTELVAKEYGKGGVFIGADAVKAGLVDRLGDQKSLLAELSKSQSKPRKGMFMSKDDLKVEASEDLKILLSAMGVGSLSEAIGSVAAYKEQASQLADLKGKVEKLAVEKAQSEISSLIEAACKDGRVTPANKPKMELLAEDHGVEALKICLSTLSPVVNLPVKIDQEPAKESKIVSLTDREKDIASKMGISVESVMKNKLRLLSLSKQPVLNDEDEDEQGAA